MRSRKARAPPPPVCCPCSGQGAATQHRAPAGRTATPGQAEDQRRAQRQGARTAACVEACRRSIHPAERRGAPQALQPRTQRSAAARGRSGAPTGSRPSRPPARPIAAAMPKQPEPRAHWGWGRRGAARRGAGREPALSPELAEGRAAARARSAGSSRIPHKSKDAAGPGVACRGGLRGCRDHAGPGFIAELRREGAPTAGRG